MIKLPTGLLVLIIVLSVLLAAVIFFSVWAFIEPHVLKVTNIKMRPAGKSSEFKKQSPTGAPSAAPGIRLFFFSDLHADICLIKPERLISAIREAHASSPLDAVVFGGDICNNYRVNEKGLSYLKKISDACTGLGIPFYGVTGNHDFGFDPSDSRAFFGCIENKQISFTSHSTGKTVILSGLDDSGRKDRIWYKVPETPADCVSVVAVHNPDSILHFSENDHVDFMLSGHFHAGQIKMPFKLEFLLLRADNLPKMNVIEGVFEHNGTTLFISRGVGCNKLPLRFGALPEVSVVEIFA
ncbi:MAG: metallophosphoesterase [Clostridiales bacterium]|nr:metallophosphoesterase [Clostridiales bacterium]